MLLQVPEFSLMFQNILEVPKKFGNVSEFSSIFQNVLEGSRSFWKVPEFSRMFLRVPEVPRKFRNILEFSRMFQTFSKKFQNVLESFTMFLNILECFKTRYRMVQNVFQKVPEYSETSNCRCYVLEISLTLNCSGQSRVMQLVLFIYQSSIVFFESPGVSQLSQQSSISLSMNFSSLSLELQLHLHEL